MRLQALGLSIAAIFLITPPIRAATFTVVTPSDAGAGSLRAAILAANGAPGPHRIVFNIPFAGVQKITLHTPLPEVLTQTAIDATTQPGYFSVPTDAGTPMVELDGSLLGPGIINGINLRANQSSIRGLSIGNFANNGVAILAAVACTLAANHLGCDASGTVARPNFLGLYVSADLAVVGGSTAMSRNVISGNMATGLLAYSSRYGKIYGNFIGTNAAGTAAIPNGAEGVFLSECKTFEIGGENAGEGNLISGNASNGLSIVNDVEISSSDGHYAYNNLIGTDVYGASAIPNFGNGVYLRTQESQFGHPSSPNTISGNLNTGIYIEGPNGRRIGLYDNRIGVTSDGLRALGNGAEGVWANDSPNNDITHNTIGGNANIGLLISGASSVNNLVEENYIGTNKGGAARLGNNSAGIWLEATSTEIRGKGIVAYNQFEGIIVRAGSANTFAETRVYGNEGLDIDLVDGSGFGITPNDLLDADGGANELQNYPLISSVSFGAGQLRVMGSLHSTANAALDVHVFSSPACHTAGSGGGETWVGAFGVNTNTSGNASFDVTFLMPAISGNVFTALASAPTGTSEFSPCYTLPPTVAVEPAPTPPGFELGGARPQPARGEVRIPFVLAEASRVRLHVFDARGRRVSTVVDESRDAGPSEAVWDPAGQPPGIFWYRLEAEPMRGFGKPFFASRRLVITR